MYKGFVLIFAAVMIMPCLTYAEDAPPPARKTMSLEAVQKLLSAEEKNLALLEKESKNAEGDLKKVRQSLANHAKKMRAQEREVAALEERIESLSAREKDITSALENEYGMMIASILALERIQRVPPQALMVRPGDPLEAAQAAIVLKSVLPSLNEKAKKLSSDLEELRSVQEQLLTNKHTAISRTEELQNERKALDKTIAEREKLYKSINRDYKASVSKAEKLAAQANSLRDLVSKLDEEEDRKYSLGLGNRDQRDLPEPQRRNFKGSLPAEGRVLVSYGQKDDIGARSEGLKIKARPGGVVTSPASGKVLFSGPFRNYGQLLIIEHRKGLHSLVAGMERITASVGQRVSAGEPLGYMASRSSHAASQTLYYEVRRNGDPVDPAILLSKPGS